MFKCWPPLDQLPFKGSLYIGPYAVRSQLRLAQRDRDLFLRRKSCSYLLYSPVLPTSCCQCLKTTFKSE